MKKIRYACLRPPSTDTRETLTDLIDRSDEAGSCRISLLAFDMALSVFAGPTAAGAACMVVAVHLTTKSVALRKIKVAVCSLGLMAVLSLFAYVGGRPPPHTCFVTLLLSHLFFSAVQNLTLSRGMVLAEIFGNKFKRVNATTRTVLVRALFLSIPDVILTVSWFMWGVANGSISVHRSGFGCGHPNGQFLTSIGIIYRCVCVLAMLVYWKKLRVYKHAVAEQTCATLKSLAVAYYLTVAGLAITAIAPVDMARYASYVISFSATLGLSLLSMFGGNLAVAIWPVDTGEVVEVPSDIRIVTSTSTIQATVDAAGACVKDCCKQLSGRQPNLIVLSYTEQHEPKLLRAAIQRSFSNVPIIGASTCTGVLSPQGFASSHGCSLGVWMVCDPEGVYTVAHCAYHTTPLPNNDQESSKNMHLLTGTAAFIAGQQCINRALFGTASAKTSTAGTATCSGDGDPEELPPFVWMCSHPGHEEELISGMKAAFGRSEGDELAILGSSAADNHVKQNWSVLSSLPVSGEGDSEVAIAMCWPSVHVKISMFSAYAPQARSGEVTKVQGRRILEIGGQPAAQVLNTWSAGTYQDSIARLKQGKSSSILSLSAMFPLGVHIGYDFEEEPWYHNIHPSDIGLDGSVGCFAEVRLGQEIVQMSTTADALVRKLGVAAKHVIHDSHFTLAEIKGSLAVYCGGCMLAVQSDMDSACHTLSAALGNAPYMGVCSFGEQGPGPEGHPVHANLMFCTAVFSSRRHIPKYSNSFLPFSRERPLVKNSAPSSELRRRHSTSTNLNVAPDSALAHFQGPTSRHPPRRSSSGRMPASFGRARVAPQGPAATRDQSSDTQFGDSVLYGMEEDIPVSPMSHSSSLGLPASFPRRGSGSSAPGAPSDLKASKRPAAVYVDVGGKYKQGSVHEPHPSASGHTIMVGSQEHTVRRQGRATRLRHTLRRVASANDLEPRPLLDTAGQE